MKLIAWSLAVLVGLAALVVPLWAPQAPWKLVNTSKGYMCEHEPDGTQKPTGNLSKSYSQAVCNDRNKLLTWINSAEAAVVRTRCMVNPDGSCDSAFPNDAKNPTPPSLGFDATACAALLGVIANQTTGTATNLNIDTACLTGTNKAAATLTIDASASAANWSITGSSPNRLLHHAGVVAGSGTIVLRATYMSNFVLSSTAPGTAYPWSYVAPATDTTPPNPVTGMSCTPASTTTITCTFDSTVDPADGVATSGIERYQFFRNGTYLSGQDLVAASSGMVNDFTPTAIGTASGTATQTGASWALFGNGGTGTEGTADGLNSIATAVSGSSFDIIFGISAIQAAAGDNKAGAEFRESTNSNSVANNCTFDLSSGVLFTSSRNRKTTGGTRGSDGQVATQISASMPAHAYGKCHYDASGLSFYASLDGGAWTQEVSNYALAALPTSKSAIAFATATQAATPINVTFDYVSVNNVGQLTKTLTVAAGSATFTAKAKDIAGNVSTALAGWTGAPSTPPSSAIKFEPGWYAIFNKTCIPITGVYGCGAAEIVSTINTEICPNANLKGMKILGSPLFFMSHTPGVYSNSVGSQSGFVIIDQALDALAACGKFLMLQGVQGILYPDPNSAQYYFPYYTYAASFGAGGTATGGAYGVVLNTQASQPGLSASIWKNDWRDLSVATVAAYCARYEPGGAHASTAFYAIGMFFWNTSIPFNSPFPPGFDLTAYNTNYRSYLASARSACPVTNVLATLDYADPHPSQMSSYLATVKSTHASVANNDVWINAGMTWGQSVYTGNEGSPSVIDYRADARYMEEIETPDMCDSGRQTATPAQLFTVIQNGNAGNRARWPNTIVVSMAFECPAGYDWTAWKTFIASISGQVMDARGPTLRTPAYVKANSCESSMTCP